MKNKPTSFRFDESLKEALALIAERESRSLSNAIEWMAKNYFKDNGLLWPTAQKPNEGNIALAPNAPKKRTRNNEQT